MKSAPQAGVPASAEDFAREYLGYTRGLVRKLLPPGTSSQDVEDITQDIMLAEIKANVLGMYEAGYVSRHTGAPVSFRSFFSARVSLRMRGMRDKIRRRDKRELLIADSAVGEDGTRWIDVFGGQSWDDYSGIETEELQRRIRCWVARQPRRSRQDSCDLLALFDEVVREIREEGGVTAASVQQRFRIADTTACAWLHRLREIITGAGELPQPEYHQIGGLTLDLADMRSAAEILRASRGIMVDQPLRRAGHPLARASRHWYHQFAKAEIAEFPDIAIDPQTHRNPAGHVKIAVLHRLERLVGIAAADSPAPAEPSPAVSPLPPDEDEAPGLADLLEAELWHLTPDPGRVGRIMDLARQAFSPVPVG